MGDLFVKICGVTVLEDALSAVDSGADAIGFNFYQQSKRYIAPEKAAEIAARLPLRILRVGVFVNPKREDVDKTIVRSGITAIQFSGNEPPDDVTGYYVPVLKAIHVAGKESIAEMKAYLVDSYLLDTFRTDEYGGTGKSFDWNLAVIAKQSGKIILAGGLTPENIADAVRKVLPYGVDVSSGVELRPGIKDHKKMSEFIQRAREANISK